ncbi:MAG: DNA (cytosine-5-)-methyltransferase [Acidaminococcaceae bacterium]|nr:DNA (cytosine-5-)-methyltransferase [Acidaminococcaceae bacterium]
MDTELLTVSQTAEYLKLSEKTVRRLIANGCLEASKLSDRSWRIRASAINAYIDAKSNGANDTTSDSEELHSAAPQQLTFEMFDYSSADATTSSSSSAPRLVSLFSGCGGMDLGFRKAGFNVVWANDFDADAQRIYRLNQGEIDGRNIMTVGESEIPNADILTAGFPCQPFSNAGNRKGVHDSRGMLYKECLRIISRIMPKVIVFENVKGLLSTKYIDGRNLADVIAEDLRTMNGLGYNIEFQLVNAADFGVPQNRQRVLFIGVRKDLGIKFTFPKPGKKDDLTLRHVLTVPEQAENHVDWPFSPQALEMISYIPEGGSWKDVPYEHLAPRFQRIRDNMQKYHSPNFYRRFSRDEICGTITASAQPENCGIIHPTENRRYTVREVARIQTFPDDFHFITDTPKDITAMYKVIGNAVPVTLAYNIATEIMRQVFQA